MVVNQFVNIDLAKQRYLKFYKNNLVRAAVAQLDQNFIYEPTKGISEEEFLKTQIYTKIIFRSEDMISGAYKGVKFTLSEVISQKREYKSARSDLANFAILAKALYDRYMDFTGSVLVCEFDKKFSFKTIIVSKELNTKILGVKERFDNVAFMDSFRVFTDDKIESRYLITPSFMEKLHSLKANSDMNLSPSVAFMDNKFYLFLFNRKNHFESSLFSSELNLSTIQEHVRYVSQILSIIGELNLSVNKERASQI